MNILDRSWIEINLDNLEHNINEIKKIISDRTDIMAVVKANAYGHGMIKIAKKLNSIGIYNFAVATLEEGIDLRKNNIKGDILILGYTDFSNLEYVVKYDLIQTIVDYNYSLKIKELPLDKIKCHIKINTGMNRIGEAYNDLDKLFKIYENDKLDILGTYSHLCVADSNKEEDILFTNKQIERFDECIKKLKINGYNPGKVHIQSSYGTLNYSNLNYDFVRIGILMYGVNSSTSSYQSRHLNIKPVLSIKARITSIKRIDKGEAISYGRTFIADNKMNLASIGIGYADGIPRSLSNKDMVVKVKDEYKKVIGRICMDQLVIDITGLKDVCIGDIVTLIGNDDEIKAEVLADKINTITNELLCRLGSRLKIVEVMNKSKKY